MDEGFSTPSHGVLALRRPTNRGLFHFMWWQRVQAILGLRAPPYGKKPTISSGIPHGGLWRKSGRWSRSRVALKQTARPFNTEPVIWNLDAPSVAEPGLSVSTIGNTGRPSFG